MKIIVLGGDGFCGWPTSLHLAKYSHDVLIIDNLSRRNIESELSSNSLTDISTIADRISAAQNHVGNVEFRHLNIATQYCEFLKVILDYRPDAIVHFAEQRSAPYSMLDSCSRRYTVDNNITGTHNVCAAIVESKLDINLVHLGTMGVYGYNKDFGPIPEGYLDIEVNQTGNSANILYPANPGSIYHMTKCLDQLVFQYYNKNWGLNVTDLHQGIVWGVNSPECLLDEALINRFDYDGIYGTVLNRFITQAAKGIPLSIYGTGGQSRAFINISDTARCIRLAVESPAQERSRVRIFNQVAEVHSVKSLANIVHELTKCEIAFVDNPRKELLENDLEVSNDGLTNLGFRPVLLEEGLVKDTLALALSCKSKLKERNVNNSPKW